MNAHLQLVTPDGVSATQPIDVIAAAIDGGVDSVQLRDTRAVAADLMAFAGAIARLCRARDARLIVNDRVDVALALRAHGVQLGARGIPLAAARALLEPWQLLGASVHGVADAIAAERAGADYVTFGHVYDTPSHAGAPARGLAALHDVVTAVRIPVLAIGGITRERVPDVLPTGCAGVAVIRDVFASTDAAAAARALRDAMDGFGTVARAFPERRD